jgi:hypothetical protein
METIEETMSGNIGFNRKTSVTIIRNGDLATECYLKVSIGAVTASTGKVAWCRRVGHNLINSVTVSIGGSQIDKQYSQWLDLWYELTHTTDQERGYLRMVGDVPALTNLQSSLPAATLYVPLQFWFNRNTGLALPLIALQYHEVRLDFEFNNWTDLMCWSGASALSSVVTTAPTLDASLLVNYVYLDSEERRRFAQVGHEYLIEQVQFTGSEQVPPASSSASTKGNYRLGFNHPTKELVWAVVGGNWVNGAAYIAYQNTTEDVLAEAASNFAKSLFCIATSAPSNGSPVNVTMDGTYTLLSGSVNVTTLLSTADSITRSGTGAGTLGTQFSGVGGGNYALYMISQPFGSSTSPFQGGITDVLVTLTANGANALAIESVTVTAHTLTMRDVSIPVATLTAAHDYRVTPTGSQVANTCATDVYVNNPTNYGLLLDGSVNPVSSALIQLNGQDRFDAQAGDYFNYVQTYQHHTRTPSDGVNVYSFALHPEQHQPSGSCNLSRIDNTQLNLQFSDSTYVAGTTPTQLNFWVGDTQLYVFAFSYNVLRVMSGMGGLAYSN